MTEPEFKEMLERYLAGRSGPGERQVVEQWANRLGQSENLELSQSARAAVQAAVWQRIEARINAEGAPAAKVVAHPASAWRAPALRWAAAAVLVPAAVGLALLTPGRWTRPSTPAAPGPWTLRANGTAQPQAFALQDGSAVTLYPGSSLKYRPGLAGPRREVYLVGQAFFKVHKNPAQPFLVYTNEVVTTVLGTSFMVKAFAGRSATVAVREGRVSVQARAGAQLAATPLRPAATGVVLLPNQEVVYSPAEKQLRRHLVAEPVVLVPHLFEFKKRPVAEVLAALRDAYGVDIIYDQAQLAHCTVTITFYDESLFNKLDLLCKALDASYQKIDDAQIRFISSGCPAAQ